MTDRPDLAAPAMPASSPRTAAGQRMDATAWHLVTCIFAMGRSAACSCGHRARILAIEAEAAHPPPPETRRSAPLDVEALAHAMEQAGVPIPWPHDRWQQASAVRDGYARLAPAQPVVPLYNEGMAAHVLGYNAQARPADAALLRTGRLIEIGDDFLERMAEQANPGYRVTMAWGEPDADGVYTPTLTTHNWSQLHSEAMVRLQELVWAWEQQEGFEVALERARAALAQQPTAAEEEG